MVTGIERAEIGDLGPDPFVNDHGAHLRAVLSEIVEGGSDSADYIRFVAQRALLWDGAAVDWSGVAPRIVKAAMAVPDTAEVMERALCLREWLKEGGYAVPDIQPHGRHVAFGWQRGGELMLLLLTARSVEGMAFRGGRNTVRFGRTGYFRGALPPSMAAAIPTETD